MFPPPLQALTQTLHGLLQFHGLFCYHSMHTCIYIHSPRFNLLGPYNANYVFILRVDHLALDKQLMCFSLGKIISPIPNIPQVRRTEVS